MWIRRSGIEDVEIVEPDGWTVRRVERYFKYVFVLLFHGETVAEVHGPNAERATEIAMKCVAVDREWRG